MIVASQYLTDSCCIYSYSTSLKGNTEVVKTLIHEDIPCHAYKISNLRREIILGVRIDDTFKITIPFMHEDAAITVRNQYKIVLTKDGNTYQLKVEDVTRRKSYWEVDASEDK